MLKRLVAGQTLNGLALLLLAAVAGGFPRVWGSYPYRPAEMLAFWLGFGILLSGMRLTRSCLPPPYVASGGAAPSPSAAGPSLAVLIGLSICIFSLINFLYTTLWGLRWLPDELAPGRPHGLIRGIGVAWMAAPLLVTAACQIPLGLRAATRRPEQPLSMPQPAGVLYWLAVAASTGLFLLFLGASMVSAVNRHALAAVVAVTLLEALVVTVVSLEQFLWSLPRTTGLPPPYTAK